MFAGYLLNFGGGMVAAQPLKRPGNDNAAVVTQYPAIFNYLDLAVF